MSSTDPPVGLPQGVRLQRLAPRSSRARNAHPEWEVWVEKERIGLIQQWRVAARHDPDRFIHKASWE